VSENTTVSALHWLIPVGTLVLGWFLNTITEHFHHRQLRRDRIIERRGQFQQETLLALQEAIADLARAAASIHFHDMNAYMKSGEWSRTMLTEGLSEEERAARARTAMLAIRVRDDKVREFVDEFKAQTLRIIDSDSAQSSKAEVTRLGDIYERLQTRIGEILRSIYDDESKLLK
jgi:hypothetical protein